MSGKKETRVVWGKQTKWIAVDVFRTDEEILEEVHKVRESTEKRWNQGMEKSMRKIDDF